MTYLQLVNKVLTRLREDTVDTVAQNTYSTLIGEFVNDAKRMVEDAWDWSALRQTKTVSATSGDNTYSLTGTGAKTEVLYASNNTSNYFMEYKPKSWFEEKLYFGDVLTGSPRYYTFDGLDSNGDIQVLVYPTPDATYSLRFSTVVRGIELEDNTDSTYLPSMPIIMFATALAIAERGEAGGQSASEFLILADKTLSDAIALDSARQPEELIYRAV
jgi:hypothetical protein